MLKKREKSQAGGIRTGDLERITPASTAQRSYYVLDAQGGHIKLDRYNALRCNNARNELSVAQLVEHSV